MNLGCCFALILSLIPMLGGCNRAPSTESRHDHLDDLVLIEFAARLEDDYHKIHPEASRFYHSPPSAASATPIPNSIPEPTVPNTVEPDSN